MRSIPALIFAAFLAPHADAFSMKADTGAASSRRAFLTKSVGAGAAFVAAATAQQPAFAAPEVFTTPSGIKYAVLKQPKQKAQSMNGDLCAIEYTGYKTDGTIFDGTHSEGKKNALLFVLGSNAVIDGINEMVAEMGVGEKRQVIMPSSMAFKDKGICVETEDGKSECLIKPNENLVYDITLLRTSIPPP